MKIFKYTIGLYLLSMLVSCKQDLGNYDYHEINEIGIKEIKDRYSVLGSIDTLRIEPIYSMTEDIENASRFEYFWMVKKNSNYIDTIGREKNLQYPVRLAPDNYVLQLRVVDTHTKVTWTQKTNLTVGTPYSRGWLLMGENENGFAELDMISIVRDTFTVKNILAASGLPQLKDPLLALHTGASDAVMKLWVSTNSGAYYLDRATMKGNPANNFGKLVYMTDKINKDQLFPAVVAPQIANANGGIGNIYSRAVLTSNGHIFANSLYGVPDLYANPVNRHKDDFSTLLKAAPYLMYSIGNFSSLMWYDTNNNRFMNLISMGFNTSSDYPRDDASDAFPWNQAGTGRKLVYAENTRNTDGGSIHGNTFAVMRDENKNSFIYKFYAFGDTPAKRAMYAIKSSAVDFDKADFYTFSSTRSVVFYSVGNKLYAYDYNPGNEKSYQFPEIGADQITMLNCDTQFDAGSNSLYVATYNGSSKGKLKRYTVGNNPNIVELQEVKRSQWDGLVKIKSMNWRAVN